MKPVIDLLTQTRKSLTLRSLFLTGFPHDPEFFAAGVALARQWSRQGLKIAVIDLDYRHPTLVRPRPLPNEGLVDALEYGCSFQRVAWELVADALWMVGPGSHPPDEQRFIEHPDWTRVMRIFSARVDIALFLGPFLDRKGFTGALSKRMDGVILSACVRRSSRVALRDAFLELWGSDAPMIGCIGVDTPFDPTPPREVQLPGESAPPAPTPAPLPAAPTTEAATPTPEWTFPTPEIHRAPPASPARREPAERGQQALVDRLSDEVRRGHVPSSAHPRSRALLVAGLVLVLAAAGVFVTYQAMHRNAARATAPAETLPAGTEPVLPADLGAPAAGTPSVQGGAAAPTPESPSGAGDETASQTALPYGVQVASFHSEGKVRDLVKRLRAQGLDAWYAKAADPSDWYHVFVGHYATHEEAARQAAFLLDNGLVEHAIAYPDHAR
jgi:septal ring-binding cell division protein DamX